MNRIRTLAAGTLALALVAIGVGVAFLMSGKTASRPEKTYQDYFREANLYMDGGEYLKAIVSFEKALSLEDDSLEAMYGLASAYSRESNYNDEETVRKQIAELDPDNLDNHIRLVEIMIQNEALDDAKQRTEELLESYDSDSLESLYREMTIATPQFNLSSGSYDEYQLLEMTSEYNNALVYYTVDGSEPTKGATLYTDGIVISHPETEVRAKAIGSLGYESDEVRLNFSITKPVEGISLRYMDYDDSIYRISNNLFNRSYNSEIFNYELAQIRELYILGSYNIYSEPQNVTFFEDYYLRYENRETDEGNFDLEFARYTPFLKTLSVGYQGHLDLTPLESLKYVESLSLLNNNITDVEPLKGLTSLRRLALGWNNISDVSALAELDSLESLGLWNNDISDISMLGRLKNLTYFDISHNDVAEIDCVGEMRNLSELWINGNSIEDISALDNCDKLMVLMQGDNPISNLGDIHKKKEQIYKTDLEW